MAYPAEDAPPEQGLSKTNDQFEEGMIDMEKQGVVSLWLGKCCDFETVDAYLSSKYSEDGDSIDSDFEVDFQIDWFDEDLRDAFCRDKSTKSLTKLLKGCSYCDSVLPNCIERFGAHIDEELNAGFLLYDFDYSGDVKEVRKANLYFRFMGSVEYSE